MTYRELAIAILLVIGLPMICVPIHMFADWLFEKIVCKDCKCKDCEHYKKEDEE